MDDPRDTKPDDEPFYDAEDDFAKSIDLAYATIRERMANGGPGWEPSKGNRMKSGVASE